MRTTQRTDDTAERDLNGNGWFSGLMLERGVACHARNLVVRRGLLLEPLLDPRVDEALRGVAVVGAGGSRAIGGSAEVRERLERNDTLRKKRPSFSVFPYVCPEPVLVN